jgi:hypothetical protein
VSANTNPPPYTAESSLPLGVAILAVLIGLFGILWILGGILILASVTAIAYFNSGGLPAVLHATGLVAGAVLLIVGLIILGLALGLWHRRMWALVLTLLVLLVVLVSYGLAGAFVSYQFIVSLVLFVYLVAVNRHFQ